MEDSPPNPALIEPYAWVLTPQNPGFTAEILEFPGCVAEGETAGEALSNLVVAAESWIAAVKAQGRPLPPPLTNYETRGQFALRLPGTLYNRIRKIAARERLSVNTFITMCLCEAVGFRRYKDEPEEPSSPE